MDEDKQKIEKSARLEAFTKFISQLQSLPGLIRLRDAPAYLAMDRNRFNKMVRPYLIDIPIGEQGIAFDRLDLDAWIAHYKQCSGRPGIRRKEWDVSEHQDSTKEDVPGISTNKSTESAFQKVVPQVLSKRRKDTLPAE